MRMSVSLVRGHILPALFLVAGNWLAASSAQALEPRRSAADYPHHCQVSDGAIGVEFMSRSLPTPRGSQLLQSVLVFEVGLFPAGQSSLSGASSNFLLDHKGQKGPSLPLTPEYVAAALRHPEWRYDRTPQLVIGAGQVDRNGGYDGVTIGGPSQSPRFPGDNRPIPQRPEPEIPGAPPKPNPVSHADDTPDRVVVYNALPRGDAESPTAGYIYFPYEGKLKKLKRVTLTYLGGGRACEMEIRP